MSERRTTKQKVLEAYPNATISHKPGHSLGEWIVDLNGEDEIGRLSFQATTIHLAWAEAYKRISPRSKQKRRQKRDSYDRAWFSYVRMCERKKYPYEHCKKIATKLVKNMRSTRAYCISSPRVARPYTWEEVEYNQIRNNECCGFFDDSIIIDGQKYLFGFNYGH